MNPMALGEKAGMNLDLLPPLARELVDVLGIDAALALLARFRGQCIYVPAEPGPEHPVTRCLGPEAAAKLGAWVGGDFLPLPTCDRAVRRLRDAGIVAACRERTVNAVIAETGVSRRTVFYAKRRMDAPEAAPPQADLFSIF